jgi:hypothetical protein
MLIKEVTEKDVYKLIQYSGANDKKANINLFQSLEIFEMEEYKFLSVGLIFAMFTALLANKNDLNTFIEAQSLIGKVQYTPMSIREGRKALRTLMKAYKYKHPPVLFCDETQLSERSSTLDLGNRFKSVRRMVLLRSIARCLRIVIVFTGTDSRASNFCNFEDDYGSGGDSEDDVEYADWAIVFNRLPSFDKDLFTTLREEVISVHPLNEGVHKIVEFIGSVLKNEVPWIISLCLEYLRDLFPSQTIQSTEHLLGCMLGAVLNKFMKRKASGTHCKRFDRGQAYYICNLSWNSVFFNENQKGKKETLRVTASSESHIHRHFGFLYGFSDLPGSSSFSLINVQKAIKYRLGEHKFVPMSVFPPFDESPLLGLVILGISDNHPSFIGGVDKARCTAAQVMTKVFRGPTPVIGNPNNGHKLETLTHISIIQASRVGGLAGCSLMEFVCGLVRELSPMVSVGAKESVLPKVRFENTVDPLPGLKLPLLSPMATISWCKPVFDCLKNVIGSTGQICLGVYKQTLKSEPADGIAYYQDSPTDSLSVPCSNSESLRILQKCKLVPKNISVNVPRYSKCFNIRKSGLPRIAYAVECKQYSEPLTAPEVAAIIKGKFDENYPSCDLFFIVSLSFTGPVSYLSYPGYSLYILEKLNSGAYQLRKTVAQTENGKCVILLSLKVIWGAAYGQLEAELNSAKL